MPMTINDARQIGESKLRISRPLFDKSFELAKRMGVRPQDLGPMTLALAILGVVKANKSDRGLEAEMHDALVLVSRAETEWNMERKYERPT